jgi:hypothetical protein
MYLDRKACKDGCSPLDKSSLATMSMFHHIALLYSGKLTHGGNFRYIRDLNISANLRKREYLIIKVQSVYVIV